jgi:transposase-like protein
MKTKQSDFVEQVTFRMNADAVKAIQKSGQSAPDWFRQAARNRLESERNSGNPHDAADGRMNRLEQEVAQLRKEIVKLQQSESIVQAALLELRKTLTAIQQHQAAAQQHHVELRRSLEQMNAGFGHAFNTLGSSLMVALGRQLDQYLQKLTAKAEEDPPVKRWPPAPPRTQL